MKKVELEVIALSHSITHSHSYAVVLGEIKGNRRIPIVIGGYEAQAIAIALEKMTPSRPLTHDLMKNICGNYNIELQEVIINNLSDGIFFSQLICKKGKEIIEIDSRTSDALALALRFECPIYTFDFIIDSAGIVTKELDKEQEIEKDIEEQFDEEKVDAIVEDVPNVDVKDMSLQILQKELEKAINSEDYELAARIRDEMKRRNVN
tara:strand:+ start:175 stop:795 length:621 start_codon:yes stop_codon:yes gene_type:complete